jgi:hypothetical protein
MKERGREGVMKRGGEDGYRRCRCQSRVKMKVYIYMQRIMRAFRFEEVAHCLAPVTRLESVGWLVGRTLFTVRVTRHSLHMELSLNFNRRKFLTLSCTTVNHP